MGKHYSPEERRQLIRKIIYLRFEGMRWADIATRLCKCGDWDRRTAETAADIQKEYRQMWREEYADIRSEMIDEVEAKGRKTEMELTDSLDESIRQRAGHSLLAFAAKERQRISDEAAGTKSLAEALEEWDLGEDPDESEVTDDDDPGE